MMPIRRMKIKAAPNIMGGISKKVNASTSSSLNKEPSLTLCQQDSSSDAHPLIIQTFSCDSKIDNYSLLKYDERSPISDIKTTDISKEADVVLDGEFGQRISSDKCQLINSEKEVVKNASDLQSLPLTKLDLARRMKIKMAPNVNISTKFGLSNNSIALSSVTEDPNRNMESLGSSGPATDNNKESSSRPRLKTRIGSISKDKELAISHDINLSMQISSIDSSKMSVSETQIENYKTSDKVSFPVSELNTVVQQELGLTNSTACLKSASHCSSSVIASDNQHGYNLKRNRNKCAKPNIASKPKRLINLKKTSEGNHLKENINHIGEEDSNDSFSIPSNFSSKFNGKKKSKENYLFKERKLQYKQKMKSSNGNLEVNEMPLFYLIFHNPSTNPMPQQRQNERERRNSVSSNSGSVTNEIKSRRTNKEIEADVITSETLEELRVEEEGLQIINEEISIRSLNKTVVEKNTNTNFIEDGNNNEATPNVLAPQVKLGPDGNLIIDEKSLMIQTTAAKNRDKILNNSEVVEENEDSSHYGKWSKRRKRATEWTKNETLRFYKALALNGTDFQIMSNFFAWRTRAELKIKFKKEERNNPQLIDTVLREGTQFDFSNFNESDYDPEEDRKESKEAKKAEAKRQKELEQQKRQEERSEERKIKRDQICADKKRKKRLRELCKSRKKPKVVIPLNIQEDSNESNQSTAHSVMIEPEEVICEIVFSNRKCTNVGDDEIVSVNTSEDKEKLMTDKVHSQLPNEDEDKTVACSTKVLSGNYLNLEGISDFEEPNNCSTINQNKLKDRGTLIVPIEDYPVDVLETVCNSEEVIGSVKEKTDEGISAISSSIMPDTDNASELIFEASCSTYSKSQADFENMDVQFVSDHSLQTFHEMAQIILPVSSVKKNTDGSQYVEIDTGKGLRKIEPVPHIPPSTSNIIVVFSHDAPESGEQVFHVYFVSPVTANEPIQNLEQMELSSKNKSSL